ncbi:MAG: thioester reductase domain-containing protein, partial [Chloroflexota bacterium]
IFLTGATGFVGAYLLQGLLATTDATVHCHVRAQTQKDGLARLKKNLQFYKLWQDDFEGRIRAVFGFLTKPNLGFSKEVFTELGNQVDVIYHNGALVNFAYPYQALKAANVYGTREVLRLASLSKIKPVHFISSISVLFDGDLQAGSTYSEDINLDELNVPFGGYGQSKWISEKMLIEASQRGIPITVFRPDNVSGDTTSGIWNADNMAHTLLKTAIVLQGVPDLEIKLGIVPVDFVRDAILHLSVKPESFGKVFHLTSLEQVSFTKIIDMLTSYGFTLEKIPLNTWKEKIYQMAVQNPEEGYHAFYQLIEHLGTDSLSQVSMPRMDLTNTLAGIKGSHLKNPNMDIELLGKYIQYMDQEE